jgi:diaminohydroxyphosphoribosylaminopyrimidine deaminase/5-amino-6-(5-phosphoribosylamino)uracil reductase
MSDAADHAFMARALTLARRGIASTDPNPAVGCVIVSDGQIVGEGFTQRAGGNHAEIEALLAAGEKARGATVYVTLEPCSHKGRTGPCASALIEAGVGRVVFAIDDPNPAVAGGGEQLLAAAGIATESPLLAAAAEDVNRGYFSRHRVERPWVRCKMAASLDGRTALANGASQWITGEAARQDVHRWRARSSAVMTGIGTLLADDPTLNARWPKADVDVLQPKRVIVDSNLKTPPDARTLSVAGDVVIFAGSAIAASGAGAKREAALIAAGAQIETVAADPHCDLLAVVRRLAELEVNDVWLESGPSLAGAMLTAGLVDELILYFAPSLLGCDARGLFNLPPLATLDDRIRLEIDDLRKIGEDLRIIARPVSG